MTFEEYLRSIGGLDNQSGATGWRRAQAVPFSTIQMLANNHANDSRGLSFNEYLQQVGGLVQKSGEDGWFQSGDVPYDQIQAFYNDYTNSNAVAAPYVTPQLGPDRGIAMDELQGVQALDYWNNPANLLTRLGAEQRDDGEGHVDWYLPTYDNPGGELVRFDENGAPILNENGRSGGKFYDEDLAQSGYARNDYIQWADTVGLTQDQAREYIYGPGSTVVNDPRLGSLIKAGNRDASQWNLPNMEGFGNSGLDNFMDSGGLIKMLGSLVMPGFGLDLGLGSIANAVANGALRGGALGAVTGSENILQDALAGGVAGGIGGGLKDYGVTNPGIVGAASGAGSAVVRGQDPIAAAISGGAGGYANSILSTPDASWGVNPRVDPDFQLNSLASNGYLGLQNPDAQPGSTATNPDFQLDTLPSGYLGLQNLNSPALGLGGDVNPIFDISQIISGGLGANGSFGGTYPSPDTAPAPEEYKLVPPSTNTGGTTQGTGIGGVGAAGLGLAIGAGGLLTKELADAGGIPSGVQSLGLQLGSDALLTPELVNAAGGSGSIPIAPSVGQGAAVASGLTGLGEQATGAPKAAGAAAAAGGGLLSRILGGTATADDWAKLLGGVGGAAIGAYGADKQADAYRDVANQYFGMGAPYRDRLNASYDPNFKASSIAGFDDAINSSSNAILRKLSTQGNPYDNPGGLMEANRYVTENVALPAINTYRSQLGTFGQLGTNQAGAASGNAIQAGKGVYDSVGYGLGQITNPPNSIDELLKKFTINTGSANNGTLRLA